MIIDPAAIRSVDGNLNTNEVGSCHLEAVGPTYLKIHHMKKCGIVDATISVLPCLEYAFRLAQYFAATDKVAPAKLALNGYEIEIQGLIHANGTILPIITAVTSAIARTQI